MNSDVKKDLTDPVVTEFSAGVRRALGPRLLAIYWFGSRARGAGTRDSDYDFLLETRQRLSERDRDVVADVAVDMSADKGVLIDIHYRTSEAIVYGASHSPFIESVLAEAVAT